MRIQEAASRRLDDIYRDTRDRRSIEQADRRVVGLFDAFGKIQSHAVRSRSLPAKLGVEGIVARYERHLIYWRRL